MRSAKTNTLLIRTPEGIVFSLLLASPVSRFLGWAIDAACISAAMAFLGKVLGAIGVFDEGLARASFVISYFVISIGYGMASEWFWRGQTIGKKVMRLRVVDEQGLRLEFSQVVVRNLLRFLDSLPLLYGVGGAACFFTRKSQRFGDLAAGTIVVRAPELSQPDIAQITGGKFNSLLEYRHLAARLRQRVSPRTASVALEAILRRDQFEPQARLDLFAELAAYFRSVVEFPAESVEQLSDEQYVRNVVEILFAPRGVSKPSEVLAAR